jgi:hypothetical protein
VNPSGKTKAKRKQPPKRKISKTVKRRGASPIWRREERFSLQNPQELVAAVHAEGKRQNMPSDREVTEFSNTGPPALTRGLNNQTDGQLWSAPAAMLKKFTF